MKTPVDRVRWLGVADIAELQSTACRRILDSATRAISLRGKFVVVLAGGNTPRGVYRLLSEQSANWPRWNVYFGDERCVPIDDPRRNSKMAADAWLNHVPIPKDQVHPIPAELGADAAAVAYSKTVNDVDEFDLVLLGVGEDGHTASLFPDIDWTSPPVAYDVVAILAAPTPPPQRVSLSPMRLSRTREALFMVAGESKREALLRWRAGDRLPAALIDPPNGADVLFEAQLLAQRAG